MEEMGDATKRMITREVNRNVEGLKQLNRNKPYSQIRTASGIIATQQDGIVFDLDGYERTEPLPDVA